MHLHKVRLQNFKSHSRTEVSFRPGTNAICGENKVGKTSLLQAIGLTLFGFCSGPQLEYVREGTSFGHIEVEFVSALDERLYSVVRQIGTGAHWKVVDVELSRTLQYGATDVQAWLRDHLGLDQDCDLPALFEDAVGVPQGELTTAFTERPAQRRQRFNTLLHVDDYQTAFTNLLSLDNYLKGKTHACETVISGLEGETKGLPQLIEQAERLDADIGSLDQEITTLETQIAGVDTLKQKADAAQAQLTELKARIDRLSSHRDSLQKLLGAAEANLDQANTASRIVGENAEAHQAFMDAEERLKGLGVQRAERDRLVARKASLEQDLAKARTALAQLNGQLRDVDAAEASLENLAPLVRDQDAREKAVEAARSRLDRKMTLTRQRPETVGRIDGLKREIRRTEEELAAVARSEPEAARFGDLSKQVNDMAAEIRSCQEMCARLADLCRKRDTESKKRAEAGRAIGDLTRALDAARAQQMLADQLPARQEAYDLAARELAEVVAEGKAAKKGRDASADGLCPFLRESCKNVAASGRNLVQFFDDRVSELRARYSEADVARAARLKELEEARAASQSAQRIPDLAAQIDQRGAGLEASDALLAELQQQIEEIGSAEARLPGLQQEHRRARAECKIAQEAWEKVAQKPALEKSLKVQVDRRRQEEGALAALDSGIAGLGAAEDDLKAAERFLQDLGHPPRDPRTLQAIAANTASKRPQIQATIGSQEKTASRATADLDLLMIQLAPFANLDEEMVRQEAARSTNAEGHRLYLSNSGMADQLGRWESEVETARLAAEDADSQLGKVRVECEKAATNYDAAGHQDLIRRLQQIQGDRLTKQAQCSEWLKTRSILELQVGALKEKEAQLERARQELDRWTELSDLASYIRQVIRSAGPEVTRELVGAISSSAQRFFNDLMGDHSVELQWTEDFEIRLRNNGRWRSLTPAAGSERVASALAVRMALLQCMSGVRFAFFDEPTIHLDEARRTALVDQLMSLPHFTQLFVISHDDSFERATEHVIHLELRDGATTVVTG